MLTTVRPAASRSSAAGQRLLGLGIDRRGRLVEDQEARGRRAAPGPGRRAGARRPTGSPPAHRPARPGRRGGRRATRPGRGSRTPCRTSSSVAPSRPTQTFSRRVVSNRNPSWGTIRIAARRASGSTVAQVDPADPDRRRRSGRPAGTGAWRWWSCPTRSRRRPRPSRPPGCGGRSPAAPRRRCGRRTAARRARPPARPSARVAPSSGSSTSTGRRARPRIFRHPAMRDLRLVEDLAQLGDREQEEVHQEHERDQLAQLESPAPGR